MCGGPERGASQRGDAGQAGGPVCCRRAIALHCHNGAEMIVSPLTTPLPLVLLGAPGMCAPRLGSGGATLTRTLTLTLTMGAQLQMHCAKRCNVRTVSNSMVCHIDPFRHFSSTPSALLREEVLGNSCARALAMIGAGGVVPVIVYQCSCSRHDYHISLA